MDDLVPCADVLRHVAFEILFGTGDVHPPLPSSKTLFTASSFSLVPLHLHAVVGERAVQRRSYRDFCDHLS